MSSSSISIEFSLKTDTVATEKFSIRNAKENVDPNSLVAFAQGIIDKNYLIPSNGTKFEEIDAIHAVTVIREKIF